MALILASLLVALLVVASWPPTRSWSPEQWVVAGSLVVLAPMTAKLVAIVRARRRVAARVQELLSR